MSKRQLARSLLVAVSLCTASCSGERGADAGVASKPLDEPSPSPPAATPAAAQDEGAAAPIAAKPADGVVEDSKAVPVDVEGAVKKTETIPECAELERRSLCSIEKLPDEVARKEVKRALDEAMATWGEFAADAATRSQAASACSQAIGEGEALWTSQGC